MILKARLDTGAELTVPIQYAHLLRGVLVYKHAGDGYEAGIIDLDRADLIEFEQEDDDEPDSGGTGGDGGGERADLGGLAAGEMPISRGPARIGFGQPDARGV